ncbi:hypothetical protein [Achromobacter mucicolens]|uniref:hypothetical protein n=1 Tax=Achromobacter mucicolens TaxID=1389922 RepID=UPI0028AAD455|nr:hypothetical protein [Achromobacter mucicolens]
MEKLYRWCVIKHPQVARMLRAAYAIFLVVCIFGGGYSVGSLLTWKSAFVALSEQAEVNRQQREDYRQALAALSATVSRAAGTAEQAADRVDQAAEAAEGAIKAAKGAATKASTAATKATAAAKSASTVVKKVDEVLSPPPAPPARVPDWLNTP